MMLDEMKMIRHPSTSRAAGSVASTSGFSMVELLVVLGIVGLATAVLLPAVQTVRRTAATTLCADNLRTLGQAITGYVNDHQFYPYGYYVVAVTAAGQTALTENADPNTGVYVWWSVLRGYVSGNGAVQNNGAVRDESVPYSRINQLFNCPSAISRDIGVDYVPNAAVMVQKDLEAGLSGHTINRLRNSLARATGVYSDTALLWDAPEIISSSVFEPNRKTQYVISYQIDATPGTPKAVSQAGGLLATPKKVSWRYRNVSAPDRINFPADWADHTPIYPGRNEDVSVANSSQTAGGIRFRHGANNEANFLFADGSVRTHGMSTGTLLRKYFRSKLPPGFSPIDAPGF